MELQSRHVKQQMEMFAQQLAAVRELATEIIQEVAPAAQTSVTPRAQPPASDAGPSAGGGYASYAPSSSVTPGSGRGY